MIITRQEVPWGGAVPYPSRLPYSIAWYYVPLRHHMQTQFGNQLSIALRSWTSDLRLSPYLPGGQHRPHPYYHQPALVISRPGRGTLFVRILEAGLVPARCCNVQLWLFLRRLPVARASSRLAHQPR